MFVVEGNWPLFLDESDSNTILWNAEQISDFGGEILPAWIFGDMCKFGWGFGLLELEEYAHDCLAQVASIRVLVLPVTVSHSNLCLLV